jgi:hypothetical protein
MLRRLLVLIWAGPYTLVGLILGTMICALGGSARIEAGCVEFALRATPAECAPFLRRCPYRAITLGHVILAFTSAELVASRKHEHIHVLQYERWGVLFGPAYLCSSIWALVRGRDMYWDNHFEVEARRLSSAAMRALD